MQHHVWLSLGSNLGDRYATLISGAAYLFSHGLQMLDCSGIYETAPVGFEDQPDFYNMVIHAATELEPFELLEACQEAENAHQRERVIRWGPRTLDVDILLYDDLRLELPELTLPHPRMAERAFVLGPMGDMDLGVLQKHGFSHRKDGIVLRISDADAKIRIAGMTA
ncbi:MAG: 2-amino-4-hydroxy-6-hydroxymethyldihydropteridine diphosphokinase [Peptococcaceae bacterium]|nr:2-amino-4-hydroxy-6-hydroxymethyldihydropteridine diphosphokinase [Peptococcaceae bacterium]